MEQKFIQARDEWRNAVSNGLGLNALCKNSHFRIGLKFSAKWPKSNGIYEKCFGISWRVFLISSRDESFVVSHRAKTTYTIIKCAFRLQFVPQAPMRRACTNPTWGRRDLTTPPCGVPGTCGDRSSPSSLCDTYPIQAKQREKKDREQSYPMNTNVQSHFRECV